MTKQKYRKKERERERERENEGEKACRERQRGRGRGRGRGKWKREKLTKVTKMGGSGGHNKGEEVREFTREDIVDQKETQKCGNSNNKFP